MDRPLAGSHHPAMVTANRSVAIPRIAWSLWGLTVASCLGAFALSLANESERLAVAGLTLGLGVMAALGTLVVSRRSHIRGGWMLLAVALSMAVAALGWELVWYLSTGDGTDSSSSRLALAVAEPIWALSYGTLVLLVLTAPSGTLPSPRWRLAVLGVGLAVACWAVGGVVNAYQVDGVREYLQATGLADTEGIAQSLAVMVLFAAGIILLAASAVFAVVAIVLRFRRSQGEQRQQLKWVVSGCAVALIVQLGAVTTATTQPWAVMQDLIPAVSFIALSIGFGFSLLRYRLWDIDLVVKRSVIYGTLWLAITAVYLTASLVLGLAASQRVPVWFALVVTVAATLLFQPARRSLETAADRWIFGRRPRPLAVVSGFGEALGETEQPGDIAEQLARSASLAMPLAWVRVDVTGAMGAEIGIRRGERSSDVRLAHGTEVLGQLTYQTSAGSSLTEDEIATLEALCSQAGTAISHALLASRIVRAQEDERRRIERNIHDGAQQELVALVARLGLARQQNGQLNHAEFLAELQQEIRSILANLRELAQGVHPSVLSDGGLVAAVEDRCSRSPIPIALRVAPELRHRRFEPDIEGAAYFVVAEGLTNILRHSGARSASVDLTIEGETLSVRVSDDGAGFALDAQSRQGGLQGLADRLQATGGTFRVSSEAAHGTQLRATLPVVTAALR